MNLSKFQNLNGWIVRNESNDGNFDDYYSKKPWIFCTKIRGYNEIRLSSEMEKNAKKRSRSFVLPSNWDILI